MPNALLTINYARVEDLQNSKDLLSVQASGLIQRDDLSITPTVLSRYFLYNRSLGISSNFGLNDESYLNYSGGFLTVDSKLDTKFSDFSIEKNLTINLSSVFVKGFDMRNINGVNTNRITNIKSVERINDLISQNFDNEAISVGSFKRFWYHKGMIMMWSGSYNDLLQYLPFWRLCAPPDSGNTINGVSIPNLQGKFIMGGSYQNYTSYDNFNPPRAFSSTTIGSEGGQNNVTLTIANLPPHNHSYNIVTGDGTVSVSTREGSPPTFYTSGGGILGGGNTTFDFTGPPRLRRRDRPNQRLHSGGTGSDDFNTTEGPWDTIATIARDNILSTIISNTHDPIKFERLSQGQEDKGNGESHENRPPFYALAYIIYVGVPR